MTSLLMTSGIARLAMAGVLLAALWLATWWRYRCHDRARSSGGWL
ncbi:hypothetical protein ACLK2E_14940 [Escherichia coli]